MNRTLKDNPPLLCVLVAFSVFILDQASKLALIYGFSFTEEGNSIPVTSFFDLVMVHNKGISYGLFQQNHGFGQWLLIILSCGTVYFLPRIVHYKKSIVRLISTGLILGGALGNMFDRLFWGHVIDFIHLHAGSFSWYVFNGADIAIVAGVLGIMYDSYFVDKTVQ
jgi:signal peptidase II